ncbi:MULTISPECIES: AAA-like domain-containing protein [unclassified Microcystis]|jgi:hypothetical protein|uniref:AAA-like domain-containing protein n=1 Tax=unclassified Microcystis TaxID=2643300 RepID=UPI0022C55F39|nr:MULTISPECIES: AAA-like domain-containing protein [unclassified Microcystis]MCA2693032.1 AAA-like domain-containing protein [Microcystis sp. M034S2]MCA2749534.1 AAA-like domain-containing protein [Microcystis sp. M144S2]MCZ8200667.1 AAA-like domain-containing protein [Microcystis sp. LE19-55.1A]MCZ8306968.1 AAA-like domain-containing protein [Microcystis sp. LE19-98.1E]
MIDALITALNQELALSAKEIADLLWLAMQVTNELDSPPPNLNKEEIDSESVNRGDSARLDNGQNRDNPDSKGKSRKKKDENEPKAGLYPRRSSDFLDSSGLRFKVPDAPALREPLKLAGALKPLMRRLPTGTDLVLDEEATIERIAAEGIWLPVLRPTLEPWLDLELVVEEGISMQIWQQAIADLERLLKNYGIFRDVRVWGLLTDKHKQVRIRRGIGSQAKGQSWRSPAELVDPTGRRLILVVSDCVSSLWRKGKLAAVLELWTKQGSMAIVQMLPKWLWKRTALGRASEVLLQGLLPGDFNQQLMVRQVSLWEDLEEVQGVKVPVFSLEVERVAIWAQMLSGRSVWATGYLFKLEDMGVSQAESLFNLNSGDLTAEDRVQGFRVTASPMARKLAGLLAAAPMISLPIVRLIQETLLRESQQVHVAEVFLGGLLEPLSVMDLEANPNDVLYEFMDGVRDLLVDSVPSGYVLNVMDEVSKYVAKRVGLSLQDFAAVLRNPQAIAAQENASNFEYFATVTAQILRSLGGEYEKVADELESNKQKDIQEELETIPNIEYQLGGTLPTDSTTYIKRKADDQLYEAIKTGKFCLVPGPRQTGKSSLIVRAAQRLRSENFACGWVDFSRIISIVREDNSQQWYYDLIYELTRSFELREHFDFRNWLQSQKNLSPPQIFTKFIEDILLREISDPIIIFMDDFDCLLSLKSDLMRDDFFSLLKVLYERRNFENKYNRLNFVLSFIYLDSELIQNKLYVSPPSMNAIINLDNFSYEEALPLAQGLREKTSNPEKLLREVLWWTGGQPFLTQRICHLIQKLQDYVPEGNEKIWLEELVRNQVIDNCQKQDNLEHFANIQSILNNKRKANELLRAYRTILLQEEHGDKNNEIIDILTNLAGIVVRKNGKLQVANRIYAVIFNLEWIETTLARIEPYSTYYIERPPIENMCYEEILKDGCLLRIKAPHQMGKTSLLHKILDHAKKQNYMTVLIDFQSLDRSIFDNLGTFLKWFSLSITNSLYLPNKMNEYWDEDLGIRFSCSIYFSEYVLNEIQTPLILCLDEFSLIFDYPDIAGDFLPLLRGWYEESKISKQWKNLRLVLSLSTKMYSPQPINTSPFNVGYVINLPEFNHEQVESLVRAYGINLRTSQVAKLMNAIGGHPYLIQVALKALCDYNLSLEQLLEKASTEEGFYSDHLRQKLLTLEQYPELREALKQVIAQKNPIRLEPVLAYKLEALGLVVFTRNEVTIRNNLYRSYFQDTLFTS